VCAPENASDAKKKRKAGLWVARKGQVSLLDAAELKGKRFFSKISCQLRIL